MMDPDERLRCGDIEGARAALMDAVRRDPADQRTRMFLFQVFAVTGEWSRADAQLRALAQLSPEAQMLASAYGPLLQVETQRARAFSGEDPFPVLMATSPWVERHAEALTALAKGPSEEGERLRDEAFAEAPDTPGEWNGRPFQWIADADPRFGPTLEVVVGGRWGLTPFEAISQITSEGPKDLRDTLWLPVQITLRSGQAAAAFLHVRYPGSEVADDAFVKLGRSTVWKDDPVGQIALGQRLVDFDNGEEEGLLSLRQLVML